MWKHLAAEHSSPSFLPTMQFLVKNKVLFKILGLPSFFSLSTQQARNRNQYSWWSVYLSQDMSLPQRLQGTETAWGVYI